jgi:hypothetical protein
MTGSRTLAGVRYSDAMRSILDGRRLVRPFAVFLLVVAGGGGVAAQMGGVAAPNSGAVARKAGVGHTDLFIEVPLESPSPGVVFPFGGSHHQVPGVVAVNRAPYYCVPHARAFRERAAFVAHLRVHHGLSDGDIPKAVLVAGGQVRYVGK